MSTRDDFLTNEMAKMLEPGERILNTGNVYTGPFWLGTVLGLLGQMILFTHYYAVLTNRRLVFIRTGMGFFGLQTENRGVLQFPVAALARVDTGGFLTQRSLTLYLKDGSSATFRINTLVRQVTGQKEFASEVPARLREGMLGQGEFSSGLGESSIPVSIGSDAGGSRANWKLVAAVIFVLVVGLSLIGFKLLNRSRNTFDEVAGINLSGANPQRQGKQQASNLLWLVQFEKPGQILAPPLVSGNRVYVSVAHQFGILKEGCVYCLDAGTGEKVWTFDRNSELKSSFFAQAVVEGRLYFAEKGEELKDPIIVTCLDAATGAVQWTFQELGLSVTRPFVTDGKVYFSTSNNIYCLNARTGSIEWQNQGRSSAADLVVVDDQLVAGRGGIGQVFVSSAATGRQSWYIRTRLSPFGVLAVHDKRIYVSTSSGDLLDHDIDSDSELLCLDMNDPSIIWSFTGATRRILTGPVVDQGHVYFGARDGCVYCLDRAAGKLLWKSDLGSPIVAAPVLGAGAVYAVSSAGRVYILDPNSGAPLASPFDLETRAERPVQVLATPCFALVRSAGEEVHRLYLGANGFEREGCRIYCLEDR